MKVGVVFPQTEIGSDPIAVRDYAQTSESLDYNHILAFDHVLGANRASRPFSIWSLTPRRNRDRQIGKNI